MQTHFANVKASNMEMLISQATGVSPTYKWLFEGSRNEDAALSQNECDSPAERLLSLPVTTHDTVMCCRASHYYRLHL